VNRNDRATIAVADPSELDEVERLVTRVGLPTGGIRAGKGRFWLARDGDGRVVGCVGLEPYGAQALLRSLAVDPSYRGVGTGRALVETAIAEAGSQAEEIVLLTTTARAYFARLGFGVMNRADLRGPVNASEEVASLCPDTATVMVLARPRADGRRGAP